MYTAGVQGCFSGTNKFCYLSKKKKKTMKMISKYIITWGQDRSLIRDEYLDPIALEVMSASLGIDEWIREWGSYACCKKKPNGFSC